MILPLRIVRCSHRLLLVLCEILVAACISEQYKMRISSNREKGQKPCGKGFPCKTFHFTLRFVQIAFLSIFFFFSLHIALSLSLSIATSLVLYPFLLIKSARWLLAVFKCALREKQTKTSAMLQLAACNG